MAKNLQAFLNPKRKENLKFPLSSAFVDEEGKPVEWELRELSTRETIAIMQECKDLDNRSQLLAVVAEALVCPDLHDAGLLKALSEREGRPILKALDALIALTTDAESGSLILRYSEHNELIPFHQLVEEAKN